MQPSIEIYGAQHNNLKKLDVFIPLESITVITGPSGCGKSSLAFHTLYAEGQRRYVETLSTYVRQFLSKMPQPQVQKILHIPPAIALEQKNTVNNPRSTVSTQTEIADFLRILFGKIGQTICPFCDVVCIHRSPSFFYTLLLEQYAEKKITLVANLIQHQSVLDTPFLQNLTALIQASGYHRILVKDPHWHFTTLEALHATPTLEALWLVIDRFKVKAEPDTDEKICIQESITQALRIGHNQLGFYDMESQTLFPFKNDFSCPKCHHPWLPSQPDFFSFSHAKGACQLCSGSALQEILNKKAIIPFPHLSLKNGAIRPWKDPHSQNFASQMRWFAEKHHIPLDIPYENLSQTHKKKLWNGENDFSGIQGYFKIIKQNAHRKISAKAQWKRYTTTQICPECQGDRLQPHAHQIFIQGHTFIELQQMPLAKLHHWVLSFLPECPLALQEILQQLENRLRILLSVGVGYLTGKRLTKTLSGGELQRIHLATHLGSGLSGTLYVLDEPSIGLHASDTHKLLKVLRDLQNAGNTIALVEHDLETICFADFVIELGPQGGSKGGYLITACPQKEFLKTAHSLTSDYIQGKKTLSRLSQLKTEQKLELIGCCKNNLKNISVFFPLNCLVTITGVSGSGKSTLIRDTLVKAIEWSLLNKGMHALPPGFYCQEIHGASFLNSMEVLDQNTLSSNNRSNAATTLQFWDDIRLLFSSTPMAIEKGYSHSFFSFNTSSGRCETCKGAGKITLDMSFMAPLEVICDQCDGKRFQKDILEVKYQGRSVFEVLEMTVEESLLFFQSTSKICKPLKILCQVGLGYLKLGQSSSTLSGGEKQRLRIAEKLIGHKIDPLNPKTHLLILDEPTTGLHLQDIQKLLDLFSYLITQHISVILIEHHLDVIQHSDWIIDLGPSAGPEGGYLMAEGTPASIASDPHSLTGLMLRQQKEKNHAPLYPHPV